MKGIMRFGPLKRSCSSINLMQLDCPEHCEPPLIVETHRSCGSSPARSRPHHCHETYDLEQCEVGCKCSLADASEQMISLTASRPLKRSRSQNFYPTGYFNALDVATGIRNALHGSQQGGVCVSKNRSLQRLRLHPTPMLHNSSNLETYEVEATCIEDVPLGLATVLRPKFSPDIEFQIQNRAPRGLAAVIDDCTCLEIGQQIVSSEHCHDPCARPGLSLPSLQEFHQEVASSSPRNSQVITNIDMLEKFEVPPTCELGTESVGSSRTSIRMETEVQREKEHSCLDYNSDDLQLLEPSLRTSSRWGSPLRDPNDDRRRFLDIRPQSKRKRSSMTSSTLREPQPSSSYTEPSREFDPTEDALREQLQRMSFNEIRKLLPRYPSWMPNPDSDQSGPERLSISVPAPGSHRRGSECLSISVASEPSDMHSEQNNIELEDKRRPSSEPSSDSGCSSKTSMVSFSQSTAKCSNRDSGSTYSVQVRSSNDARSDGRANKEEHRDSSESLRSIVEEAVQQAVQGELSMKKAMQKAVQQELNQRSSSSGGQPFESLNSQCCTADECQKRSPRPAFLSSDDQSAYAQIVANATRKTQEILDETQAALSSRSQSKSRPNSRMHTISNPRSGSSTSSGSPDENLTRDALDASASNGDKRGSTRGRSSGQPPPQARLTFKDHTTSITELLNSMNSVTQLLNSLPLKGDNDRPSTAARKSTGPQRGLERPPSRIQSAQWLSATREPTLQTRQNLQQLYSMLDMGGPGGDFQQPRGSQQPQSNMGGGSFQQPQFDVGSIRSSQQPPFNMPGGSFQQPQYDMGSARGSQQLLSNMGGGSFQYDMGARGSQQADMRGESFQQQQYDMGARNSQQPHFNVGSGGSFQQQRQYDMGAMNAEQSQWDMEAGASQGSFSQIQPGYPTPRSSGQGITQSWDGSEMPQGQGSHFAFDPNRPRSQSMPMQQSTSSFAFNQNNPQWSRTQSMPVGSQLAYGRNSNMQRRASWGSMLNRRSPSNLRSRSTSMMGQRGSTPGQRTSSGMSQQGHRRSGLSVSGYYPNEGEMNARSSLVFDQPEPTAYPEEIINTVINESEAISDAINKADDSTYKSESQVGEFRHSLEGDGSLGPLPEGDGYQVSEDMQYLGGDQQQAAYGSAQYENSSQQAQGMTANCQPNIQSEKLDQAPELLQSQVLRLNRSSKNPIATPSPTPPAKPEQLDIDASNPKAKTSAKMLQETDRAEPSVATPAKPEQFDLNTNNPMTRTSEKMLTETDRAKPNVTPPTKPEQFVLNTNNPMTRTSAEMLTETDRAKPNVAPPTKPEQLDIDASNPKARTSPKMLQETDRAEPNVAPPTKPEQFDLNTNNPMTRTSAKFLGETDRAKPNVAPPAKPKQFDLDANTPTTKTSAKILTEIDSARPNVAPPTKPEQSELNANPMARALAEMLTETDRVKPNVAPPTKPEQFDLDASSSEAITSEETLTETDRAKPNVVQMPCEFQHHLIKMRCHTFQHFEFVKTETHGRKSLSKTVCAMIQELEVLESRSRQKSAAYEFNRASTQQRILPKAIAF